MTRHARVAAGLWLLAACDAVRPHVETPPSEHVRMPAPPLDSLRAAPETIAVGDLRIAVGAWLGFNRMPGPRVPGDPGEESPATLLLGEFDIHTVDRRPLPRGVAVQGAWLRAADSVWSLRVAPGDTARGSAWIARTLRGGPAWPSEEGSADVIVRVRRPDGASRLVQARSVRAEVSQ